MTANLPQKMLVADNDQGVLNALESGLSTYKINVVTAKDWESSLYIFNNHKIDLCLVSLELETLPGTVLIQKWRAHETENKRYFATVLSTGKQRSPGDTALIKELGDVAIIQKPIQIPKLLSILAQAMKLGKTRENIITLNDKLVVPLLQQGKVDKALEAAHEKLEPIGQKGQFLSSQAHTFAGKIDESIGLLKNLLKQDGNNMSYHNELARLYLNTGQLKEAQKSYEKADEAAPKNLERLNEMAHLYLKLKLPEKSLEKFKDILDLHPENEEMKFDIYQTLMDSGFTNHAQDFCKQTSTPKELVRHFNNKGVMFSKKEEYVDAIDEYQKAIRLIPGHKELYRILYNTAIAHINLKSMEHLTKAHELLLKSLELKPEFTKAKEKLEITKRYVKTKNAS